MEALQEGVFPMKASRWPMMFYNEDVYDPTDNQVGLLQHHTVKRVSSIYAWHVQRIVTHTNRNRFISTYLMAQRQSMVIQLKKPSKPKMVHGVWSRSIATPSPMFISLYVFLYLSSMCCQC